MELEKDKNTTWTHMQTHKNIINDTLIRNYQYHFGHLNLTEKRKGGCGEKDDQYTHGYIQI